MDKWLAVLGIVTHMEGEFVTVTSPRSAERTFFTLSWHFSPCVCPLLIHPSSILTLKYERMHKDSLKRGNKKQLDIPLSCTMSTPVM